MLTKKLHQNQKGFGLGEILITLAIIGIITAISLPTYLNSLKQAGNQAQNLKGTIINNQTPPKTTLIADGTAWNESIQTETSTYTTLSQNNGTITLNGNQLTLNLNQPDPTTNPTTITITTNTTTGITISSNSILGNNYCYALTTKTDTAVYTQNGYNPTATQCLQNGQANN